MASSTTTVQAPVVRVTLLEDRAHVVREGTVAAEAGRFKFVVEDVSPVVCDKTLLVRVDAGTGVQVNDARVKRSLRVLREEQPDDVASLRRRLEEQQREEETLEDESLRLEERLQLLERILEKTLSDVAGDANWGRAPDKNLPSRVQELESEMATVMRRTIEVARQQSKVEEKVRDLHFQFQALQSPATRHGASFQVELVVEKASEVPFSIEYLVPGACWRPEHRASLEGTTALFETEGCVWQNTGEDWPDVQLSFSTERPSLGAQVPILVDDALYKRDKPKEEVVEMRQQTIETTGLGRRTSAGKPQEPELPGIDDAGEVQHLQAAARATVPSDGRPHRVPLMSFSAETTPKLRLLPELSRATYVCTEQSNEAGHPVLAGPVSLIRDGGFVGRTKVLYVAPGETFELGWGPLPELHSHRYDYADEKERGMLSKWVRTEHTVTVKLSNLGPDEKTLEVRERIPVSEIDKVRVEYDAKKTTGSPDGPDDDGIVRWRVTLDPHGHETLDLHYTIEKHKDVRGL